MREIKFRGKRVDNGEWVYGDIIHSAWKTFTKDCNDKYTNPRRLAENTADFRCIEVDPETIGQYTGLNDKNGKEIYEGDIVKADIKKQTRKNGKWHWEIEPEIYTVKWAQKEHGFKFVDEEGVGWTMTDTDMEVIGNIYENPELLGVTE